MKIMIYLISLARFDESTRQGVEYLYDAHSFFAFNHSSQLIFFDFPSLLRIDICIKIISVN